MRKLTIVRSNTSNHPLAAKSDIARFRLKTVDLGGPVAYADYGGEGQTLVLVHGLGGCHHNWMPSAHMLAKHARVLAVDLVGFGRTPSAGRGHGMEAQTEMLTRFVREVAGEDAVLVGNSMGGLVTLMTAAQTRVGGLVMVSPALPPPDLFGGDLPVDPGMLARQFVHLTPGLGELAMYFSGLRGGARGLFVDLLTLGTKDVSRVPSEVIEANVSMIAHRMQEQPFGHARSYLEATRSLLLHLARAADIHALAERVTAPTLILHGEDDRLVPVSFSQKFVEAHPHFALQVFEDVGHVPQMEDAKRFVDRVLSFVEPVEEAPTSRAA
jgi:glycerol-3-phosphate dehydrogenase